MLMIIQTFLVFLLLLVLIAYLIPAGFTYGYLYHWRKEQWADRRIQKGKSPSKKIMYRDIRWSLLSILIFAVLSTALYLLVQSGYGLMYDEIGEYGWIYFFISPVIGILLHDFYFYWAHRLMHHPAIFKYVHLQHHKTTMPTPWTVYSFQPLEAVAQFAIIYILVFVMPLHPITLAFVIAYNIMSNVGGHCGHEVIAPENANHWLLKYQNTVSHHDLHHMNCKYNYSLYLNFLDRWMKTFKL